MFTIPLPWPDASLLVTPPFAGLPAALRWAALLAAVLVPAGLLLTLYRYELRLVARLTAFGLLSLRLTAIALVLALVCLQPILAHDRTRELPGKVVVAIDLSSSMDVTDPQRPGHEKLRLARLFGLTQGRVTDDLFAQWLTDHEQKRDPRMELPGEQAPPSTLAARQKVHDDLLAAIDALSRADLARKLLSDERLALLERLGKKHEVEVVGFQRDVWDLRPDQLGERPPEATKETAGFTDLQGPLARALERTGSGQGRVVAVVLLTDGQHNHGPPPAAKARELGERKVPVYPVAIGARQGPPDAAIVSVRGPEYTVFKDVDALIDVKFKITALPPGEFVIELSREGKDQKPVATRTIHHDGQDRLYAESFPVKMDEPGTQTIVATIRPAQPGVKEYRADNNRLATTVAVADDRAKVLLVDGEPRWELHYLQTALSRDRLVDLKTVVFEQPRLDDQLTAVQREKLGLPGQSWPAGPDALSSYQCVILGDVAPENLPLPKRQELERYVADSGGTLILLAGKRSLPMAYPQTSPDGENDPLRRLLPIESPRVVAPSAGFPLTLTTAGREARIMELDPNAQENDTLWAGHPRPWMWGVAGTAKPGATTLAGWLAPRDDKAPLAEREKRNAVVARHNYGFGRVLYVGLDGTWRWRYKVGDLYHHRFWGQVVRWAAADRPLVVGNQFVRFGTPQPAYRPGEPVEIVTRLSDALGKLRPDLAAGARVIRLEEAKEPERAVALAPLDRRPGQPRVLEAKLRDLPPGRYAVELAIPELADKLLTSPKDGGEPKPLRAGFTVLPPESKEMIDLELNLPLLEDLANASGGKVFQPTEVGELESLLLKQGVPFVEHHEQKLWQWWGCLAIVVGLLTAEWAMRKVAGLP